MKTTKTTIAALATMLAVATAATTTASATTPTFRRLGDVDRDGKVTASDASSVLAEYANRSIGNGPSSSSDACLGDVDRDGKVTASDASSILAYYAELAIGGSPRWPTPKYSLEATYMLPEPHPVTNMEGTEFILGSGEHFALEGSTGTILYISIPKANSVFALELSPALEQEIIRCS